MSLYNLPKDILIQLLTTIQDPKNMSDQELKNSKIKILDEVNSRKLVKIKEYLLEKQIYYEYKTIIEKISTYKNLTAASHAALRIIIDNITFELVNFNHNFSFQVIGENTEIQFLNTINTKGEYKKYVDFFLILKNNRNLDMFFDTKTIFEK
jgi:hypothetical protein